MIYSKAPYNFIPLSKRVFERYLDINSLPAHNEILKDGYTGTIEYTINCESDLILSDGKGHFFKDTDGNYAIPGSSVRGMIRNNIITLGFCSIIDDIENSRFLYRRFATKNPEIEGMDTKNLNKEYTSRLGMKISKNEKGKSYSILENVRAGYIKCTGNEEYEIVPAKNIDDKHNYIRVSEEILRSKAKGIKGINYMYYNGKLDGKYSPYCINDISFELNENNKYLKTIKKGNELKFKGVLISSGSIFKKQAHYIINEKDEKDPIKIDKEDIRAYKKYYVKDKKTGTFYLLPKKGEEKAVFYVEYNNRVYFGFTPYLRLFYDESVHDGIPEEHKENILDYNKALFGFANGNKGYKSRLSFNDAKVQQNTEKIKIESVLADPKPTCIAHYLKQNKKIYSTYNQDFNINGIKFYWFKDSIPETSDKKDILSYDEALKKGTKLKGSIEFNNLLEDELGLLLYSICLEKDCFQQIGKGKPYGFGRIKIENVQLNIQNNAKRYSSIFSNSVDNNCDINKYISYYKKYICSKLNIKNIEDDIGVKNLINVKSKIIKDRNEVSYLELKNFRYFNPLPTAEEFLKNIDKTLPLNEKKQIINSDNPKKNLKNKETNNNYSNNKKDNNNKNNKGSKGNKKRNEIIYKDKETGEVDERWAVLKDYKCEK